MVALLRERPRRGGSYAGHLTLAVSLDSLAETGVAHNVQLHAKKNAPKRSAASHIASLTGTPKALQGARYQLPQRPACLTGALSFRPVRCRPQTSVLVRCTGACACVCAGALTGARTRHARAPQHRPRAQPVRARVRNPPALTLRPWMRIWPCSASAR